MRSSIANRATDTCSAFVLRSMGRPSFRVTHRRPPGRLKRFPLAPGGFAELHRAGNPQGTIPYPAQRCTPGRQSITASNGEPGCGVKP
ncbi:hypothetical protein GCM10010166_46660 [Couchioplanes caeruleus subsp. azureus]|nr:hypothetical protein GCM10010166_46660 [Couchioplanes caeruleus subsp. azureus]